jgi:hypothetical protein
MMKSVFTDQELLDIAFCRSEAEDLGGGPPSDFDPCRFAKARVRVAVQKSGGGSLRCTTALRALAECLDAHYVHGRHHARGVQASAWLPLRPGERVR